MAPRHMPTRDHHQVEFIRSFRPSGSTTVVSLWDATANVRLPLLRWGDALYAPVYEGMRFAVDVYNGRDRMIALPTYLENANLWEGGPLDPESCAPSHMWEIDAHQSMLIDALMNPAGQRGRPIVITRAGFGATVGEATFGTDAFRGQLRIYERMPVGPETTGPIVPSPSPLALRASLGAPRAAAAMGPPPAPPAMMPMTTFEAPTGAPPPPPGFAPPPAMHAPPPAMHAPPPAMHAPAAHARHDDEEVMTSVVDRLVARGKAGFGAGHEEVREHFFTGVSYHREAAPVAFLRAEMREDLEEALGSILGPSRRFDWPSSWGDDWIRDPWMWPVSPTAPHIPVTRPR